MKSKTLVSLVVVLLVIFNPLMSLAQVTEQKAQLYVIYDLVVKPTKINDFKVILNEMIAKDTKHKLGYPYYSYRTGNFHHYFSLPVANYGDYDSYLKAWNAVSTRMGVEQHKALYKRLADTYEHYSIFMMYSRPDLSYIPENPRLKSREGNFIFLDIFYIQTGKEEEFEKVLKEFVALEKSKNISEEINMFVGDIGTEMPVYIAALSAKNNSDFFTHNEKMWEILGKEGDVLFQKVMSLVRRREFKRIWFLPDLSYIPKE